MHFLTLSAFKPQVSYPSDINNKEVNSFGCFLSNIIDKHWSNADLILVLPPAFILLTI